MCMYNNRIINILLIPMFYIYENALKYEGSDVLFCVSNEAVSIVLFQTDFGFHII